MKARDGLVFAVILALVSAGAAAETRPGDVLVTSRASLLHVPFYDEFTPTPDERWAAARTVRAVSEDDVQAAGEALAAYDRDAAAGGPGGNGGLRWLCEYVAAPPERRARIREDPYGAAFLDYWTADDAARLRQYVDHWFRNKSIRMADPKQAEQRADFLDRLMRLDHPDRGEWERSAAVIAALDLEPGDRVVDAAAGTGFYTLRLAEAVGRKGRVYAVTADETSKPYLTALLEQAAARNVKLVAAPNDRINVRGPVDAVLMASRYGEVYTTEKLEDRDRLVGSIRKALKPGGTLAILDHGSADQQPLPGRQTWVDKTLIVAQLVHYGFDLVREEQLNAERYLLVFRMGRAQEPSADGAPVSSLGPGHDRIRIHSRRSLICLLGSEALEPSPAALKAARYLLRALEHKDRRAAAKALAVYERIVPIENFGGEYTALQWFAETLWASESERQELIGDRYTDYYYRYFSDNDAAVLREYLKRRYRLEPLIGADPIEAQERWWFLEDLILFNNPRREAWEKTSRIISALDLQPGRSVADIGSGPGYYSFQFAERVGPSGRVYAIDINRRHHEYVADVVREYGIPNIETVLSRPDDICLDTRVDLAFLCSLYHVLYAMSSQATRDGFVGSIRQALKPDGLLAVADNDIVAGNEIPYHGPRIARELIVAQLRHYGFELTAVRQFTPQRYVLMFKPDTRAPAGP